MSRYGRDFLTGVVLLCVLGVSGTGVASAERKSGLTSAVTVKIKMPKAVFKTGEPVDGKVVLTNLYPAGFPVVFNIRVVHNDQVASALSTALKAVPQGTTEFSFKNFGIPQFNRGPEAEGAWRITIVQQNLDQSQGATATLQILPEQK